MAGRRPVILDGGMSNALRDRGHDLSDELWTATVLRNAPEEIAAVHRAYYDAGADCATTASYQASISGFERAGRDPAAAADLIRQSVLIARSVRDELAVDGRSRLVAASVGPYGAVLADGSEYRGRYGLSAAQLRDFHLPRLELLASAEPDLLAVETIPDIDEAAVLVGLLDDLNLPAWVSYSTSGGETRAGQDLSEAFAVAAGSETVVAVGVNCCPPGDVLGAVELARSVTTKEVVVYPNSGEVWNAERRAWQGASVFDAQLARSWVAAGASYVGGCCRVGPSDIKALVEALE